jgi:hypothetical protein
MTTRTFFLRTTNATLRSQSEAVWVLSTALTYPVGTTLELQLRSLECYNVFAVITSANNRLVTSAGSYTLPTGSPSASTLATQIQLTTGLICIFDSASLKFTLTSSNGTPFSILSTSTCLGLLGFRGPRPTPATTHESDTLCNLAPPTGIDVATNFVVQNSTGEQIGTTRLASVPITGGYGDLIQWYEPSPDSWSSTMQDTTLTYIRVSLTDTRTETALDLQGTDWGVVLLLREVPPVGGPRPNFKQEMDEYYRGNRDIWQPSEKDSVHKLSEKVWPGSGESSAKERRQERKS